MSLHLKLIGLLIFLIVGCSGAAHAPTLPASSDISPTPENSTDSPSPDTGPSVDATQAPASVINPNITLFSGIPEAATELKRPGTKVDPLYGWRPDPTQPYDVITEDIFLTSVNGNTIFAHLHKPVTVSAENPGHGIVLVPGGKQKGDAWHNGSYRCNSDNLAESGFIVIDYDAQGRGRSEGVEDIGGSVHREDLKAVIDHVATRDDVLPVGVGLVSSSFGLTVCAGTLATYPDLPVRFYIDKEGSHDRFTSTQWNDLWWVNNFGNHDTSDLEFWQEREAIRFAPFIKCPYVRIQSDLDHALDFFYVDHAIEMCNAAAIGASPYVRMNNNAVNQVFDKGQAETYQYENVYSLYNVMYDTVLEMSISDF